MFAQAFSDRQMGHTHSQWSLSGGGKEKKVCGQAGQDDRLFKEVSMARLAQGETSPTSSTSSLSNIHARVMLLLLS